MGENKVFIDTNYFVALINPVDSLHKKSLLLARKIKQANYKLFTTNFVFLEAVTVVSQRVGRAVGVQLGKKLLNQDYLQVVHIDEQLQQSSWEIFRKIRKKDMGFIDCSILAVLNSLNIKKLLTFDQEDFAGLKKRFRFSFFK